MRRLYDETLRKGCLALLLFPLFALNIHANVPQTWGPSTSKYRNVFVQMGYAPADVEAKVKEVFNDVFRGPNKVYFQVGDSMAYVSDIKNHDVRTEGMSYGMMVAVQFGEKDMFDRLWRWTKKYMQHQSGQRQGYFAWSCKTDGSRNSDGAASDGELYFITALIFASNRWGDDTGINYKAEAQRILNCIQPREYTPTPRPGFNGFGGPQQTGPQQMYLIHPEHKLITFTPDGFGQRMTDPSYHIPAFYEVWAQWGDDGRADFWNECAAKSREFLHKAINSETGLNPDMCQYDGSLMQGFGGRRNGGSNFRYDSWRVPMNIALDYEWSGADREWQEQYGERIQNFFYSKGLNDFVDQYRVDGSLPSEDEILPAGGSGKALRHSIGLVATTAAASVMCHHAKSKEFVDALWNAKHVPFPDGYFDAYYDGLLRLFAFMHLSGKYRVIPPKGKQSATQQTSPNGKLTLRLQNGRYVINYKGQTALQISSVGFANTPNQPQELTFVRSVKEDYHMLAGKRLHNVNEANEYQAMLNDHVRLVLRLYNDGVAFRYELTGMNSQVAPEERTTYFIPDGTRRWMQTWSDGYEGFFPLQTNGASKSHRWGYPALMEPTDGIFALISEANIERRQSASCLFNNTEGNNQIFRVVADQNEVLQTDDWHTPWRVAIIGQMAEVVESTLITDVSEPCRLTDVSWIHPGVVSWVYWAYNHGSNDFNIIKKYVDMAVALHLPYVLIDAEWDEMKDGKTIEDAVRYASEQGVKTLIWYNSSVGWINGAPGPKFRLNKPEDREKEFAWCEKIGVAGVKIDFFSGDNQMNMDYCIDLLESAAKHHLLVNFHGATIPRGWQRTYPNLLSTEGVYGAEWYNNVPTFTHRAAAHNATLPFTRNVIGPMDYTPCAFSDSQHPHITTHAHELALTVLFESALQHLADRPESFLAQPQAVHHFLAQLPAAWDDTRLIGGYPGEYAAIARRKGNTWYIAIINGTDQTRTIPLDTSFLSSQNLSVRSFADKTDTKAKKKKDTTPWQITDNTKLPAQVKLLPRGGCVFLITQQ